MARQIPWFAIHSLAGLTSTMVLPPWSDLRAGVGCPLCRPPAAFTEYGHLVCRLAASLLYVSRNQTYRGTCALIHEAHATRPSELSEEGWLRLSADIRIAERAVTAVYHPDHVNIECLGNTVPHLHAGIVPRYMWDPRWGRPIWTTSRDEIIHTELGDAECAQLAQALRDAISLED